MWSRKNSRNNFWVYSKMEGWKHQKFIETLVFKGNSLGSLLSSHTTLPCFIETLILSAIEVRFPSLSTWQIPRLTVPLSERVLRRSYPNIAYRSGAHSLSKKLLALLKASYP